MQFFPPPLSALPSPPTVQAPLSGLQGLDNFADPGPDQGGLFALILSRLDGDRPVAAPVTAVSGPAIAELATPIAAADLPPTGKPLPLPVPPASVEIPPPLTPLEVATPGETLLPLPVLPQPLQQVESPRPAIVSTTRLPATAPVPEAVPAPSPPFVAVRNASAATIPPQPAVPAANLPRVAELAEDLVPPQQTTTPSNPTVAASPSLNPLPAPAAPAASTPPQHAYTLQQPVADPQWGNELGKRLIWMTDKGIGRAELRMNPPELGPVEVRISVSNDDARVAFQVQHGATREALEGAMPRLREMFASQGLNLSDANVSEHSARGRHQAAQSGAGTGADRADDSFEGDAGELADAPDRLRARSLAAAIDTYV